MAYTINETTIDGNRIVANITVHLDDKTDEICTVPVNRPETDADVIAAIEDRVKNEQIKFDWAPKLTVIKAALDAKAGKVALTAAEVTASIKVT
jgi:uncharacterized protein YqgV (UPF0045/DUF77 family)